MQGGHTSCTRPGPQGCAFLGAAELSTADSPEPALVHQALGLVVQSLVWLPARSPVPFAPPLRNSHRLLCASVPSFPTSFSASLCALGLLGLAPLYLHRGLSSHCSVPPTGRAESWAGFSAWMVSSLPCLNHLLPGEMLLAVRSQYRCFTNPLAPSPSASLSCLPWLWLPAGPGGLCWPLPRSPWDPGWGGSWLFQGALSVWPGLLCNLR